MSVTITDPNYASQWHFALLGDIKAIWAEYSGAGVKVAVYDDGMDRSHEDLSPNYDASGHYTGPTEADDGSHGAQAEGHGTAVAGLIAAAMNGLGGVGVAWEASLTSVNYLENVQNWAFTAQRGALQHMKTFDVVNMSYGTTPYYETGADIGDAGTWAADEASDFQNHAIAQGRGGLGTILVKAAGNDANNTQTQDDYGVYGNAQGEGQNNLATVITVGALDQTGAVADYSNYGHNLLISAGAGAHTTDITGTAGYATGNYATDFGGTSAATPVVSGVVALMLEANASLGWRDVQSILAASAAQTGSAYGAARAGFEVEDWRTLGGETWNGGGMTFNASYGYGAADAYAAVRMAEVWGLMTGAPATLANMQTVSASNGTDVAISDGAAPAVSGVTVTDDITLEHVYVEVGLTHSYVGDLTIDLITPDGDVITLFDKEIGNAAVTDDWTFGVASLRGLSSAGTWQVRVTDANTGDDGTLTDVAFEFLGAAPGTNDIWHVTQDFQALQAVDAGRASFNDTDGGSDWLNAAAIAGNASVVLGSQGASGAYSVSGSQWATLVDGAIENVATGDGNDQITGNASANQLFAGRGINTVKGGGGADQLAGIGTYTVLIGEETGLYGSDASAQIYRLFKAVFGRDPGEGGHQTFAGQLASGQITLEQLTAGFVNSAEFAVRFGSDTSNADFITRIFQNVFGRDPAESGLANGVALLENGRSRAEVVVTYAESAEHKLLTQTGLAAFEDADMTAWTGVVYRMFGALFDRAPGEAGFLNYVTALANGADLNALLATFMAGGEFQARYGTETTNSEFVGLLYQNVLGRPAGEAGQEANEGALAAGMSRSQLVQNFMLTEEYVNQTDTALKTFMQGFGADDVLGATGDAMLSGGMYADSFVFVAPGTDLLGARGVTAATQTVTDLEAWDAIVLNGFGYGTVAEALGHFTQAGDDVVFADAGLTVTFLDATVAMIADGMVTLNADLL